MLLHYIQMEELYKDGCQRCIWWIRTRINTIPQNEFIRKLMNSLANYLLESPANELDIIHKIEKFGYYLRNKNFE